MRISDWSSDVCSSDLRWRRPAKFAVVGVVDGSATRRGFSNTGDGISLCASRFPANRFSGFECRCHRSGYLAWHAISGVFRLVFGLCVVDLCKTFVLIRSEEHTSELQSLMSISYAVFCLKK